LYLFVQNNILLFYIMEQMMENRAPASATSLVKALRVLLALEETPEGRGVTEIARSLDLPKSAVHRILVTFQEHGFVHQLPQGRRYELGATLARLGLRAAERFTPRLVARPYLEALSQTMGETVFLGVPDVAGVLIVDKVEQGQVLRVAPTLGAVIPWVQTALGKIFLAFCDADMRHRLLDASLTPESGTRLQLILRRELAAIERQGYAVSVEEWMPDICCVAAPVRNGAGKVVAALAAALPRSRMPQPQRHDPFAGGGPAVAYPGLAPPIIEAAEHISAALP
jgi:DNA-binding IclR family transcriptional regulator